MAHEIKEIFEVFQSIYQNTLDDTSPRVQQPRHILPNLFSHQLASIHSMKVHENSLRLGLRTTNGLLFSTYSILGDFPGSGKTLTALGHISNLKENPLDQDHSVEFSLHPRSNSTLFSLSLTPTRAARNFSSLIVVPNFLFKMWSDAISNQTTLAYYLIKTIRDVDRVSASDLEENDVVLISNSLLTQLLAKLEVENVHDYMFQRVFFDEADNIKIAQTCSEVKAKMTWLITSSFENLLFHNKQIRSSTLQFLVQNGLRERLHPELLEFVDSQTGQSSSHTIYHTLSFPYFRRFIGTDHPLRGLVVVRSSRPFFELSAQIPEVNTSIVRCKNRHRSEIFPSEVETLIRASKIKEAIQMLGISSETSLTLWPRLESECKRDIEIFITEINDEKDMPIPDREYLVKQETKLQATKAKLDSLPSRISDILQEQCSICFDKSSSSCIIPCCHSKFCSECILEWMLRMPTCPHCRHPITPTSLIELGSSQRAATGLQVQQKPSKKDALTDFLRANPEGKFVILSPHFEFDIGRTLNGLPFRWSYFRSNTRCLSDFENGFIQILVLEDSMQKILGLDLGQATHIISFSKFYFHTEKRIVGFANRVGRSSPLTHVRFLTDKE